MFPSTGNQLNSHRYQYCLYFEVYVKHLKLTGTTGHCPEEIRVDFDNLFDGTRCYGALVASVGMMGMYSALRNSPT